MKPRIGHESKHIQNTYPRHLSTAPIYVEGKGQKLHGKFVERVIVNMGADRHCTGEAPKGHDSRDYMCDQIGCKNKAVGRWRGSRFCTRHLKERTVSKQENIKNRK